LNDRVTAIRALLGAACAALASCGVSYERTGQAVLHERPGLTLAVVQVYESLPLHYYGLRHTLACRSPATADATAHRSEGLDPGWKVVGQLPGVPGQSPSRSTREKGMADAVAASRHALVDGDDWIAWRERVLRVSVDGCRSFAEFVPWRALAPADIDPAPRPDFCKPGMDCRDIDFADRREATYSDVAVERLPGEPPRWRIGAVMRSIALKDGRPRRVTTDDLGATWRVEPLGE